MNESLDQIASYFETVPLWPFVLFGLLGVVAIMVDIVNRKRRAMAIENFRYTIEIELADMYPQHKRWPPNINHYLTSRLPEMYQNFEVLRVFIRQDHLLKYNTDWNNFRDFCRTITDEKIAAAEQSTAGQSASSEPDPKAVFHQLIANLLKHTEK
ncbi:MAG: hypothetical protein LZF85_02120 [Nitrosomonas sp.]|uniref:hypothetical protein n=1 Tax=Nitrosomonas sp. TaxID=42353 RepID=UPI0025E74964|nr:hypothetical protein [Nitrosomonas sp.]UJP03276.1 MAG: hypothetical protein LZF85_02120 [Nitrosomonas sp.]